MNIRHILLAGAALLAAPVLHADAVIRMAGDSTMADKDLDGGNPERGWGMMLPAFFDSTVTVDNHAQNGRSTKSFMDEGRWEKMKKLMKKGEYVFIEFGHNDEPGKPGRSTEVGKDFDENLRTYVRDARAKKAIPVLFTPIARRKFEGDSLVDTHGAYTQAVRDVAAELGVPCIDLNVLTSEWLRSLGPEESKKYFMHVAPGTVIKCPEGKKDDTHLNARGARAVARMATKEIAKTFPKLASHIVDYDIVVAQDGSGDFMTVQEAVDAAPDYSNARTRILVREGVYREKITIPASKRNLTLTGDGKVVLSYDDYASRKGYTGHEIGTTGSASVFVLPDNFTAENITFENTAGMNAGQAVACLVDGDRAVFRNCRFLGHQDTLY
ncbi:MAG: pectin esterase, partial [Muribaculaceae bacterium]|nr:pectin esterase [Muribaculaceae bacterium]